MDEETDILDDLESGLREQEKNPIEEMEFISTAEDQFGEPNFLYDAQQDPGTNDEERVYAELVEAGAGVNYTEEDLDFGIGIASEDGVGNELLTTPEDSNGNTRP